MNGTCTNCNYNGEMTFYWLITNEQTGKAYAIYELDDNDIDKEDTLIEVDCCPVCGADQ